MSRFGGAFYNPAEKSFYKFNGTSLTWVDARQAALIQGGALVSLSNRQEGKWLYDNVLSSSSRPQQDRKHQDFWIGLTIQNQPKWSRSKRERSWFWLDGTPWNHNDAKVCWNKCYGKYWGWDTNEPGYRGGWYQAAVARYTWKRQNRYGRWDSQPWNDAKIPSIVEFKNPTFRVTSLDPTATSNQLSFTINLNERLPDQPNFVNNYAKLRFRLFGDHNQFNVNGARSIGGNLYEVHSFNNLQTRTITLQPKNNLRWDRLRNVRMELESAGGQSANLSIDANAKQAQAMHRDLDQLNLANGAWETFKSHNIRNHQSVNNQSINPTGINGALFGKFEKGNFKADWETYLYIPETNTYDFQISKNAGSTLTIEKRTDAAWKPVSASGLALTKGTILRISASYRSNVYLAPDQFAFQWKQRYDGKYSGDFTQVPSAFQYLSREAALQKNQVVAEQVKDNEIDDMIFLFSTKTLAEADVSTLQAANNTSNNPGIIFTPPADRKQASQPFAQLQRGSTKLGDDFRLSINHSNNKINFIEKPNFAKKPLTTSIEILRDDYAESESGGEKIEYSLIPDAKNKIRPAANNTVFGVDPSSHKQVLSIQDKSPQLSLSLPDQFRKGVKEGELAWLDINVTNGKKSTESDSQLADVPLTVAYEIVDTTTATFSSTGGTRYVDFYTPKSRQDVVTEIKSAENRVAVSFNASEDSPPRLYIPTIADDIVENVEDISIRLLANEQVSDKGFKFHFYSLAPSSDQDGSVTLQLKDNKNYKPGIVFTPANRTGNSVVRSSKQISGGQKAVFDFHLRSKPQGDVTVDLSIEGKDQFLGQLNLNPKSLTISPDDWEDSQQISLDFFDSVGISINKIRPTEIINQFIAYIAVHDLDKVVKGFDIDLNKPILFKSNNNPDLQLILADDQPLSIDPNSDSNIYRAKIELSGWNRTLNELQSILPTYSASYQYQDDQPIRVKASVSDDNSTDQLFINADAFQTIVPFDYQQDFVLSLKEGSIPFESPKPEVSLVVSPVNREGNDLVVTAYATEAPEKDLQVKFKLLPDNSAIAANPYSLSKKQVYSLTIKANELSGSHVITFEDNDIYHGDQVIDAKLLKRNKFYSRGPVTGGQIRLPDDDQPGISFSTIESVVEDLIVSDITPSGSLFKASLRLSGTSGLGVGSKDPIELPDVLGQTYRLRHNREFIGTLTVEQALNGSSINSETPSDFVVDFKLDSNRSVDLNTTYLANLDVERSTNAESRELLFDLDSVSGDQGDLIRKTMLRLNTRPIAPVDITLHSPNQNYSISTNRSGVFQRSINLQFKPQNWDQDQDIFIRYDPTSDSASALGSTPLVISVSGDEAYQQLGRKLSLNLRTISSKAVTPDLPEGLTYQDNKDASLAYLPTVSIDPRNTNIVASRDNSLSSSPFTLRLNQAVTEDLFVRVELPVVDSSGSINANYEPVNFPLISNRSNSSDKTGLNITSPHSSIDNSNSSDLGQAITAAKYQILMEHEYTIGINDIQAVSDSGTVKTYASFNFPRKPADESNALIPSGTTLIFGALDDSVDSTAIRLVDDLPVTNTAINNSPIQIEFLDGVVPDNAGRTRLASQQAYFNQQDSSTQPFEISFQGYLFVPTTGAYVFDMPMKQGQASLTVNDVPLINQTVDQNRDELLTDPIPLEGGQYVPIHINYKSDQPLANQYLDLKWKIPQSSQASGTTATQIPSAFLSKFDHHIVHVPAGERLAQFNVLTTPSNFLDQPETFLVKPVDDTSSFCEENQQEDCQTQSYNASDYRLNLRIHSIEKGCSDTYFSSGDLVEFIMDLDDHIPFDDVIPAGTRLFFEPNKSDPQNVGAVAKFNEASLSDYLDQDENYIDLLSDLPIVDGISKPTLSTVLFEDARLDDLDYIQSLSYDYIQKGNSSITIQPINGELLFGDSQQRLIGDLYVEASSDISAILESATADTEMLLMHRAGRIELLMNKHTRHYFMREVGEEPIALLDSNYNQIIEKHQPGWRLLAATNINGVNKLLWRNTAQNSIQTWFIDQDGLFLNSGDILDIASDEVGRLEEEFSIDLNSNKNIGDITFKIEDDTGSINLASYNDKFYAVDQSNHFKKVKNQNLLSQSAVWSVVGINSIDLNALDFLENRSSNPDLKQPNVQNVVLQTHKFKPKVRITPLDDRNKMIDQKTRVISLDSPGATTYLEYLFQRDLDNDHEVSRYDYQIILTNKFRSLHLLETQTSQFLSVVDLGYDNITSILDSSGVHITKYHIADYLPINLSTDKDRNYLLWKHKDSMLYKVWTLDQNWQQAYELEFAPASRDLLSYELIFNSDLNDDGIIGDTANKLLYEAADYILSINTSNQHIELFDGEFHQLLNEDNTPLYQGDQENHIYKAIEIINGNLKLLVHNPSNEQYTLYSIDDQWRINFDRKLTSNSPLLDTFKLDLAPSVSSQDHQFVEQQGQLYLVQDRDNTYSTLDKDGLVRPFANQVGFKNNQDKIQFPSLLAVDTFFENTTFQPVLESEAVEIGDYDLNSDVITSLNPEETLQTYAISTNQLNDQSIDLWLVEPTSSEDKKWFLSNKLWTANPGTDLYFDVELFFKIDLNNDHILGRNDNCFVDYQPVHSIKDFVLLKDITTQRLAFSSNNGPAIALKSYDNEQIIQNQDRSTYRAAISLPLGNFALFEQNNNSEKELFIAEFDQYWNLTTSSPLGDSPLLQSFRGNMLSNADKIYAAESLFNINLDDKKAIGSRDINLLTDTPFDLVVDEISQQLFVIDRPFHERILVKDKNGSPLLASSQVDKYPIAAGLFDRKNTLVWNLPNSSDAQISIFTNDWRHKKDFVISYSNPIFKQLETALAIDLNADADSDNDLDIENQTKNVTLYIDPDTRIFNVKTADGNLFQIRNVDESFVFEGSLGSLSLLSAVTHRGSNYLLLEDTQSNNFLVWPVDQNWQHNGSQSVVKPNSSKARSLEERFAIDLTNDGLLGNFRVINTSRSFDLLVNIATNQYYIRENSKNSSKQAVQSLQRLGFKGPQIRQSDSLPLSVAYINNQRAVLFKSTSSQQYIVGFYGDSWKSPQNIVEINSQVDHDQLYLFEKGFGYDLDGDSFQGSPYVSLSLKASASQGRVKFDDSLRLLRTNLTSNLYQHPINRNYYVGPSSDRAIPLKVNNSQGLIQNSGELLTTRSLLSVGQSDDGINVALLRENTTPSLDWPFVVAQFDSNWRFIRLQNQDPLLAPQIEQLFNFDTDGNGIIGVTGALGGAAQATRKVSYQNIHSNHDLSLLQDELSRVYAVQAHNDSPILLLDRSGRNPVDDHTIRNYSPVSLYNGDGSNQLLFYCPLDQTARIWTYNDSWTSFVSEEQISNFDSQRALDLEVHFKFDLNNDNYLGGSFLASGSELHFTDAESGQNVDVTIDQALIVNGSAQTFDLPSNQLSASAPLDSVDGLHGFISSSNPFVDLEEGDRRVIRSLRLNTQPHSSVVVGLETDSPEKLLLRNRGLLADSSKKSRIDLVFTPDNWNQDQFFSLHAVDNDIVDGDLYAHVYNSAKSDDYRFDSSNTSLKSLDNLPVFIRDNDQPGVHLTIEQNALNENSSGIVYASLTAQPSEDVSLSLIPPTASNYQLKLVSNIKLRSDSGSNSPESLRASFALENLQLDQYHTDVFLPEGSIFEFIHSSGTTLPLRIERDLSLNPGFPEFNVPITLLADIDRLDRDLFSDTKGLSSQILSNGAEFKMANKRRGEALNIDFNADNWDIPQAVQIEAIDDDIAEDIERGYLRVETSSDDQEFDQLTVDPLAVDVIDDDVPTVSLELLTNATEDAEPGRFRIRVSDPVPASVGNKGLLVKYRFSDLSIDERIYQPDCDNPLNNNERLNSILQYPDLNSSSEYQIRIPPGHRFSDSFVIPFDDYVADIKDKKFSIELVDNDDHYSVEGDKISMEIRNDDKAGLILLYSGDNLRVSEADNGAQMLVMLASQPTNDVTVHIDEELAPQTELNDGLLLSNIRRDFSDPDPSAVLADLQLNNNSTEDYFLYHNRLVRAQDPDQPGRDYSLVFNNSQRIDSSSSTINNVSLRLLKDDSVVSDYPSGLILNNQQARNQLGTGNGSAFRQSRTFTPSDWHIPRTFTINSYNDSIIEDRLKNQHSQLIEYDPRGVASVNLNTDDQSSIPEKSGLHPAQLNVSTSSSDSDYTTSQINYENVFLRNFGQLTLENGFYKSGSGLLQLDSQDPALNKRHTTAIYQDQPVVAQFEPSSGQPIQFHVYFDADNAFGCNSSIASGSFKIDQSSINDASRSRFNNAIANNTLNQIQIISTAPRLSDISMPVEVIDTPLPEEFTDAYITAFQDIQESLETLSLPLAGGLSGRFDEPLDSSNSPKKNRNAGGGISGFGSGGIAGFAEQLELALNRDPNFSPENIGELIEDVIGQYLGMTPKKTDDDSDSSNGRKLKISGPADSVTQSIDVRTYVRMRNRCSTKKNQCFTPASTTDSNQAGTDNSGTTTRKTKTAMQMFENFKNAYSTELKVRTAYKGEYQLMSAPLAADFGVPMFGMRADGKFELGLEWEIVLDLNFILGGNKSEGRTRNDFYISVGSDDVTKLGGTAISLTLNAKVPDTKIEGLFGPLSFSFQDKEQDYGLDRKRTALELKASMTLNGGPEDDDTPYIQEADEVTVDELKDFVKLVKWGLSGDATLSMAAKAGMVSGPIPKLAFDLLSNINLMSYSASFVDVEGPYVAAPADPDQPEQPEPDKPEPDKPEPPKPEPEKPEPEKPEPEKPEPEQPEPVKPSPTPPPGSYLAGYDACNLPRNRNLNCKKDVRSLEGKNVVDVDESESAPIQDRIAKFNNKSAANKRRSISSTPSLIVSRTIDDQPRLFNAHQPAFLSRYSNLSDKALRSFSSAASPLARGSNSSARPLFNADQPPSDSSLSESFQSASENRNKNTVSKLKVSKDEPSPPEAITLKNINLELDSAMSDIMAPMVKDIDSVAGPAYAMLDFLYKDIPVFKALSPALASQIDLDADSKVTPVDLVSWLSVLYKYKNPKRGELLCNNVARMTLVTNLVNQFFSNVKQMAEMQRTRDMYGSIERYFNVVIHKFDDSPSAGKSGSVDLRLVVKDGMRAIRGGGQIKIVKTGPTSDNTPLFSFKASDKLPAKTKIDFGSRNTLSLFSDDLMFSDEITLAEKIPLDSLIFPVNDKSASYKLHSKPSLLTGNLLRNASPDQPLYGKVDVPNLVIKLADEAKWEIAASSSDADDSEENTQIDGQQTSSTRSNASGSDSAASTSTPAKPTRFGAAKQSALGGLDQAAGTSEKCDIQNLAKKLSNLPVVDPSNLVGVLTGGNQFAGADNVLKVYSRAAEKAKPSANISEETNRIMGLLAKLFDVGFDFPLVTNPMTALGLLTGKDVDLVTWHAPGMNVGAGVQYSFPLLATPVRVDAFIGGEVNATTRMGFGFDSSGLRQWLYQGGKAEDFHLLANGFYIADRWSPRNGDFVPDPNGTDLPEMEVSSTVGPGISLNAGVVRGSLQGGLLGQAQLDLIDNGEITGQSDGRIRADEMAERIVNPPQFFELSGSVNVFVRAFVEAGFDAGIFQQWFTVWEQELARITLFEFGLGGTYADGSAANDPLKNVNVFFDGNSNAFPDSSEPLITSNQDASYHFRVDHTDFDLNYNGVIDFEEGRLIAYGGTDSGTDLSQDIPFIASVGDAINPLSTLVRAGRESGLAAEEIDQWIRSSFKLGDSREYLLFDPLMSLESPEQLSSEEIAYALNDYVAHIKTHFALDAYSTSLQDFLPTHFANELADEIDLIKDYSFALFDQPSAADVGQSLSSAVKHATLQQSDALPAAAADDSRIVGNFVADVIVDFSQKVDDSLGNPSLSGLTSSQANDAVDRLRELKKESLQAYRDWSELTSSRLSLGEYSSVSSAIASNCDLAEHFPTVCNPPIVADNLL